MFVVMTEEGKRLFDDVEFRELSDTVAFIDEYGKFIEDAFLCGQCVVIGSSWVSDGNSSAQVFKVIRGLDVIASVLSIQSDVDGNMRMNYGFEGDVLSDLVVS